MKYQIIFLIIFSHTSLFGQKYKHVDSYVESLKINKAASIESLSKKLIEPFKTDLDKTRALYYWLAKNIVYDYEGCETNYWNNYKSYEDIINDTFTFRKGICSGYSHLFKRMLELSDIESEVINGYARNDLQTVFLNESNHVWNKVLIDGQWHLLYVTWARDTV